MDASIDWLSFTLPYDRFRTVREFIGEGEIEWLERGWLGYTDMGVFGGTGRIGVSPEREDMGVHLALGSKALAVMAGVSEFWADLPGVLQWVKALGGKVTRLDVAFDDRAERLDLDQMWEHVCNGWLTSRWRKSRDWDERNLKDGSGDGRTLEFGKRCSDAFLRCYDKRLERLNAGEDDPGPWVRAELELKRDRAEAAAELYRSGDVRGFFRFMGQVLMGYLSFREHNPGDSNKRRWKVAGWWSAFLETVERASLAVREKVKRTVEQAQEWLSEAVAPTLAVVLEFMGRGNGLAWLEGEAEQGRRRWKGRHRAMLQASRGRGDAGAGA